MVRICRQKIFSTLFTVAFLLFFGTAIAQTSPQGLSLQGRILDSSNNPLEDASVAFTVQIVSPGAEECVLYEETHTLNMTGSGGVFALPVGAGTRSGAAFEDTSTLAQVFNNGSGQINSLTCSSGNSYTPASGAKRKIKMTFDNGGGPQVVTQTLDVQAVPYALYADTLRGKSPSDFLQTSTSTTQAKIDNLATNANYNELLALIAGTSANYTLANGGNFTPATDVDFNGKKIIDLAAPTLGTDATNKTYVDTKFGGATFDQTGLANGQSVRWNQALTKWEVYTPATSQWITTGNDIYYNTGKVGIGTTNPSSKLHVSATDTQTSGSTSVFRITPTYNQTSGNAANTDLVISRTETAVGSGDQRFIDAKVGGSSKFQVFTDGSILAGNSSGAYGKYEFLDGSIVMSNNQSLRMLDNASNVVSTVTLTSGNNLQLGGSAVSGSTMYYVLNGTGSHQFFTGSTPTEKMRIDSNGNVGIGTTNPTTGTRLDITGTGAASSSIIIPRDTVANRPTTGVNGMMRYATDTNKFEAYQNGAWTDMITSSTASSVAAGNGTASAPSISFSGDTNTGFYSNGADTIGIAANGANVFNISSTALSSPTTGGALITSGNGTAAAPTFSFSGDPDTGWFRPAADTMAASTAGSERVRITSSGTIGVGTSVPTGTLHLNDGSGGLTETHWSSSATGISSTDGLFVGLNNISGDAYVWNNENTPLKFATTGTERMRIAADGSVGIGTASPEARFHIYAPTLNAVMGMSGANNDWSTLSMITNGTGTSAIGFNNKFQFGVETTVGGSLTPLMTILSSGDIGIGTTSPAQKLDVNGGITASGNVGIGTASPEARFHIYAPTLNAVMGMSGANNDWSTLSMITNGTGTSAIGFNNKFQLGVETTVGGSLTALMTVLNSGNVGIGNTAPAKLLHVGSASVATGTAVANFQNIDGTCTITPAASGSGIACSSDERLKENFQDVSGAFALDRILQLQAVTYNFKTSSDTNRRTGYKAQEVQKIAPEFVRENEDGFLQVYYDAFIPWITEAIKTVYTRITGVESHQATQDRKIANIEASKADKAETDAKTKALEVENAQLKQENAEIKARLEKIEKALNSK